MNSLFSAAPTVAAWQVAVTAVVGGAVGIGSGGLAVFLEKREKLEEEELEEKAAYETESAEKLAKAREAGDPEPKILAWKMETYGWTWIERILVPLLAAGLFGLFAFHQGWNTTLWFHLLWVAVLCHIIGFDLKHRLILNVVTYPSVLVALALSQLTPELNFGTALAGAVLLGLFFFLPAIAFRGSIGLGDAKLAVLVGATTGLDFSVPDGIRAIYAAAYGIILGGVVSFLLLITRVAGLRDPIPYGPFICAGAIIVLYAFPLS
jgi:hypothetical protein